MVKFINVSNRLPITVGKDVQKSSGGLVSAIEAMKEFSDFTWVGWPGEIEEGAREKELDKRLRREFNYVPVFLNKQLVDGFYQGLSNSSLWPILHYFTSHMKYEEQWWNDYRRVNDLFADRICEIAGSDDVVWIHDYHLLLLPAALRARRPNLRIGFFLHTPFPSYEVFRCHPRRKELLEGLIAADQIGFHTFGYLRHFESTLLRILGIESQMSHFVHNHRQVSVGVYPVGINSQAFETELQSEAFKLRLGELRKAYAGKKVILGVERLDYTKGLVGRLQAMDEFLGSCRDKNNVVFVLICVPSRGAVPAYQELRESVESLVGQINGRHATIANTPIHFMHQSIGQTELCALYSVADVCLTTPLRDGMNLVAKEYVACQTENPGVLVLSEFAGASEELFTAIPINPYDTHAVVDALKTALAMPYAERKRRIMRMRDRVMRFDARNWGMRFLMDLTERRDQHIASPEYPLVSDLDAAFSKATRIAMFLDYDGTLRELVSDPAAASPTEELLLLFDELAKQQVIDTFIISGRKPEDLELWFNAYPFTLIAEHGYQFRLRGCADWQVCEPNLNLNWKEPIAKVLRHYEDNTPGSWVEDKQTSLVWHFRNADADFGMMKAQQLVSELSETTYNLPVTVRRGKMIVEVCSIYVDKGAAIQRLVRDEHYDLILVAGDDQTDEAMFGVEIPKLITIKVGPGNTTARYRVPSPAALRSILGRLLDSLAVAQLKAIPDVPPIADHTHPSG